MAECGEGVVVVTPRLRMNRTCGRRRDVRAAEGRVAAAPHHTLATVRGDTGQRFPRDRPQPPRPRTTMVGAVSTMHPARADPATDGVGRGGARRRARQMAAAAASVHAATARAAATAARTCTVVVWQWRLPHRPVAVGSPHPRVASLRLPRGWPCRRVRCVSRTLAPASDTRGFVRRGGGVDGAPWASTPSVVLTLPFFFSSGGSRAKKVAAAKPVPRVRHGCCGAAPPPAQSRMWFCRGCGHRRKFLAAQRPQTLETSCGGSCCDVNPVTDPIIPQKPPTSADCTSYR